MIYNIEELEKRVTLGYLKKSETPELVLYGYTNSCMYEKAWDEYTLVARGLILEKFTGKCVAKPFKKFFNLGETESTFLKNLPDESYYVMEKVDGSLGIIFNYKGQWTIATRGSFYSDQAIMGAQILSSYDLASVSEDTTLLVEIIYPENKIIVDYGGDTKLVLLGAYNRDTGRESTAQDLSALESSTGLRMAVIKGVSILEMIDLQKTLPRDQEGFVVVYDSGLRVKIKGDEYMRIARIISGLSPLVLWETMKEGKVDTSYLRELPEELLKDYEKVVELLEIQYASVLANIIKNCKIHNLTTELSDWKRSVGIYLSKNNVTYSSGIFPYLLKNSESLNKYILNHIKPSGNVMVSLNP